MFTLNSCEFTNKINNGEMKLYKNDMVIYNGKTYQYKTDNTKRETTFKLKINPTIWNFFKGNK